MSWRLDDLGWLQFEQLVQAILKAKLGIGVEAWGGGSDFGKDAFYDGDLDFPVTGSVSLGPFVFQVKFVSGANAAGANPAAALRAAVKAEVKRIADRIETMIWTPVEHYVLCTNVPLGASLRTEVAGLLAAGLPGVIVALQGYDDVCALLDDLPQIRLSYPEILGLRDLRGLLKEQQLSGLMTRSRFALEVAQSTAKAFVRTSAFAEARRRLEAHHFVVLSGPPEAGKTTVARMLAFGSLSTGREVFECRSPDDVFNAYDKDVDQIFVMDDAFGSTELRADRAEVWGEEMEKLLLAADARHHLIWTSRSAILAAALERMHREGRGRAFPELGEVLVDISDYTLAERALMLRQHARAADLDDAQRTTVREAAERVVTNQHVTPERIRTFVAEGVALSRIATADERRDLLAELIERTVERPTDRMRQSVWGLRDEHRLLLTAMVDTYPGGCTVPVLMTIYAAHGGQEDVNRLLADLTGHFLRVVPHTPSLETRVEWTHPSWRDLIIEELMSRPGARRAFLRCCSVNGLLMAMSIEGGVTGERNIPLLATRNDAILIAERTREDANTSNAIPLTALRTYWTLSLRCSPLPASPDLRATWTAAEVLDIAPDDIRFDMSDLGSRLSRHLELARLIQTNEPRFLTQGDFPNGRDAIWTAILEAARRVIDDEWVVGDPEGYEEWASYLEDVASTVEAVGALAPRFADEAQTVTTAIRAHHQGVEERGREAVERRTDEVADVAVNALMERPDDDDRDDWWYDDPHAVDIILSDL